MDILVGYSGFVGSNIMVSHSFDMVFNSSNIGQAFGLKPDLCVYAGVRAEKFLAANNPDADRAIILNAIENIKKINPKQLVLISTIDVYKTPVRVDERTEIITEGLHPYGVNRYFFEQWVQANNENHLIVRLPALFGRNIKKNFIYDLINVIPFMLNTRKYTELSEKEPLIAENYVKQDNGFYKCFVSANKKELLKQAFERTGFSALNFTDSRAVYQFYNLTYLWEHIQLGLKNGLKLINLAVEPLSVSEIYLAIKGGTFINEIGSSIPRYDFRTIYADLYSGQKGYIFKKQQVLDDVQKFVK